MDTVYEQFCLADPVFYDTLARSAMAERVFAAGCQVADGWRVHREGPWTVLSPPDAELPSQGWKVHISTTMDNAEHVVNAVWDYCTPRNISFKFLTDRAHLLVHNGKYADRASSGKFVTIYPSGTAELEAIVRDLDKELDGRPGPYILSDVRWVAGPLYLRYGGFARRYCTMPDGERVLAISDPAGTLVPDARVPQFQVPSWVQVPDFLASSLAARLGTDGPLEFPFQLQRPLHYSNGGGVYLAVETRTGRQVVLKEARPFAGVDPTGQDAVQRLRRERDFLEKLAGIGVVPELYDYLVMWEHHFLVEEYVEGDTLSHAFVTRFPLVHPVSTDEEVAEYTRWALDKLAQARHHLQTMHDLGIAFGDLHPRNILVRADATIRFLDLEQASFIADGTAPPLGAPGFVPPDGRTGAEADLYAMACLELSLFLPLTALIPLDPAKVDTLVDSIVRRFPVPPQRFFDAARVLRDRRDIPPTSAVTLATDLDRGTPDWPAMRRSIRDAILASATPQRTDRLFPGGVEQFTHGGIGLAYGAAGVLYALRCGNAGQFPKHEQWLLNAVHKGQHDGHIGFYDGLHGVAYVLAELDRLDDALTVLELAIRTPLEALSGTLFNGLSGVGLNLLHFATLTADSSLHTRALDAGARLAELVTESRHGSAPPGAAPSRRPSAGLMYGPAGQALLFIRLFEATRDRGFLDLAETLVRRDLERCVSLSDGTMQMNEGWRVMPYLATGSVGLGLVLRELVPHGPDEELMGALAQIRRAAAPEFVAGSGLFNGRAGLLAFLCWLRAAEPPAPADEQPTIDRHLSRLAWHVTRYRGHIAFPGDQQLRLSMDLATGSAGVLYAVSAALDREGPILPFLTPARPSQT